MIKVVDVELHGPEPTEYVMIKFPAPDSEGVNKPDAFTPVPLHVPPLVAAFNWNGAS